MGLHAGHKPPNFRKRLPSHKRGRGCNQHLPHQEPSAERIVVLDGEFSLARIKRMPADAGDNGRVAVGEHGLPRHLAGELRADDALEKPRLAFRDQALGMHRS